MLPMASIRLLASALALALIIGLAVAVVLIVVEDPIERHPISLTGIDMSDLEEDRISLLSPENDEPSISSDEAVEIAQDHYGVREVTLARLTSEGHGIDDTLVWVVNYNPLTVPPLPAHTDYTLYYLSAIDANTGEQLIGRGAADSCGRTDLFPFYAEVTEPVCSGAVVPGALSTG
jgi:hypothetical protein